MATSYQSYQDLLEKSQHESPMSSSEKMKLKREIETLESMDHIEVIRIIRESMTEKPYTVSNRQTMVDLDDLTPGCLWKISYYVNFCLENQKRDKARVDAEKLHQENLQAVEDKIKRQSKLKLTPINFMDDEDDEDEEDDEEDDEDQPEAESDLRTEGDLDDNYSRLAVVDDDEDDDEEEMSE